MMDDGRQPSGGQPTVCFTSFSAYPLFNPEVTVSHGGAEVEVFQLSTELAKRGYRVQVVVGDFGQPERETVAGVELWRGIPVGQSSALTGVMHTLRLFRIWRRTNADVLFIKGAGFLPFQASLFCRLFGKRLVFKSSHQRNLDGSLRRKPYHRWYAWALRHATALVVQNQEDLDLLRRNYGLTATVIKNYHPMPDPSTVLPREQRQHVLWVGRTTAIKRPDRFLDLAASMPRLSLVMIISVSDPAMLADLQRRAATLSNLRIMADVRHDQIDQYYRSAILFVSTSDGEGFPNTFIEAMKWGTPLASLTVNPDGCIDQRGLGAVGNGSLDALRDGIGRLAADRAAWGRCSQAAAQYARAEFGEAIISQWIHLFERSSKRGLARSAQ